MTQPFQGLLRGSLQQVACLPSLRRYFGSINLDDYKDFILDWPDKGTRYPRLLGTPQSIARLKANLHRCPDGEKLKNHYLISGTDQDAETALTRTMQRAENRMSGFDCYVPHFRQFQNDMGFLFSADTALAWPTLPKETRQKIRAKMAIVAYMLTHADYLPRGAGVHLGNPNMAINRTLGITLYGRMLPDHPLTKRWLDDASKYLKWSISHDVTPAGGPASATAATFQAGKSRCCWPGSSPRATLTSRLV